MFSIDPITLSIITGTVLPVLLGFVMRSAWPSKLKANISLVVSLVVQFLLNAANDGGVAVISWQMLGVALAGWVVTVASYNGLYAKYDVNAKLPDVSIPVGSE